MTSDKWLELFPPFFVRLLARDRTGHRAPLTGHEIAKRAGRSLNWVTRMSKLDSWEDVRLRDIKLFLHACGTSLGSMFRERDYIQRSMLGNTRNMLAHLDSLKGGDKMLTDELMVTYRSKIEDLVAKHQKK